jgi:hypothetical protein
MTRGTLGHTVQRKPQPRDYEVHLRTESEHHPAKNGQFRLLSTIAHALFVMKIIYRMKFNTYSKHKKANVHLSSLMIKVPGHVYVLG